MPKSSEQNNESVVKSILERSSYRNVESCKRDILAALHHYRGLQPRQQKYVFNDGRSRDLICLEGTIPVPYKGQSYNIPVSIFVLDTHPTHAPICYVRPTSEMRKYYFLSYVLGLSITKKLIFDLSLIINCYFLFII